MTPARIKKYDHNGVFVWDYEAAIVSREASRVTIEARMNRDVLTDYMFFRSGDRMVETFYPDRWYNIMEVHDVDDDRLKGWYCNITRPPSITSTDDGTVLIAYEDLALDAYISPVGELLVLDEDELDALQLPADELAGVWNALDQLREQLANFHAPFDAIDVRADHQQENSGGH